ncbi:MAG: enoyl-CoA hydratase/isomerase family protein [Myxococcales bacterium]|nr:enoyl-CoA hydratase/isomerase family protein [Myxococcales bacterium]
MPTALVLLERDGDVATLTFNQPERLNAMTRAMGEAFAERVAGLRGDESLRAVIVTGAGRAFSAGGDRAMLDSLADRGAEGGDRAIQPIRDTMRSFYGLFLAVRDLPCPTLAAINGHAIGAGLCVALACDMRFAAVSARMGANFGRLGIHPGMAASWTLPRIVGPAVAAELLYTSRIFDAEEAARIGLVNRAFPADDLLGAVNRIAAEIASCAPVAVRGTKRSLARSLGASLTDQLDTEASEQGLCFTTADIREGLAALAEKRDPRFEGH